MYPTILCNRITIHCTNKPEFNLHKKVYTCQVCFLRGYSKHLLTRTYFSIGSCILGYLLAIQTKQVLSNQVLNFYDGDNRLLTINPLNPEIKIEFSFVAPIHFLQTQWGEVDKISSKFILCDHVRNSHDHSVLQNIDITRRNLMLITLRA